MVLLQQQTGRLDLVLTCATAFFVQGVANRDIKLENALLDSNPRPLLKICDFGYSKVCCCNAPGVLDAEHEASDTVLDVMLHQGMAAMVE